MQLFLLLRNRAGVTCFCGVSPSTLGRAWIWNHPGGRFPKGGHIQGLALAGLLPGGMNFLPLSNPPGSDRRASRLWPLGPQHYRLGPPQRTPRLAFARHPGRSRLRPSGLPAAAAKAMISPAADPFFGEPWTSPLGRKDSKIMLRGQGPVAASFQGPWENMQPPYASLRGQRGLRILR